MDDNRVCHLHSQRRRSRLVIHRSDAPIVKRRQLPVAVATWGLLLWAYGRGTGDARDQHSVDLPGDVALEAADDLSLALALLCAPRDVLLCTTISAHPSQTDHVQRTVGLAGATAVEAMPHDLAGGGLAPQPLRIVFKATINSVAALAVPMPAKETNSGAACATSRSSWTSNSAISSGRVS